MANPGLPDGVKGAYRTQRELEDEVHRLRAELRAEKAKHEKDDPSWAGKVGPEPPDEAEEWCMEWRERHKLAFIELAEMCGLVTYGTFQSRPYPMETDPEQRSLDRTNTIFVALRTLVEIDPDCRR